VIVAVEGPSAAGKTTWCRATGGQFVAEYIPTGQEPDGSDPAEQATYWAQVNAQRWTQALTLEGTTGVAVCDSDPLKLHYSWCLAAVGAEPVTRFEHKFAAVRDRSASTRSPTNSWTNSNAPPTCCCRTGCLHDRFRCATRWFRGSASSSAPHAPPSR